MKNALKIRQTAREFYNNKLYQRYTNTACKKFDEVLNLTDEIIKLKSEPNIDIPPEQLDEKVLQVTMKIQLAHDHFQKCRNKATDELLSGHYDSEANVMKNRTKMAVKMPFMTTREQLISFIDNKYSSFAQFSKN